MKQKTRQQAGFLWVNNDQNWYRTFIPHVDGEPHCDKFRPREGPKLKLNVRYSSSVMLRPQSDTLSALPLSIGRIQLHAVKVRTHELRPIVGS